ncbi:MAG: hypothetical protein D3922_11685 [Candidatus Electrothrix sp. AR1]|nr:hypothetical protein [Candidatus Electrothrix sp. AR1]
MQHLGKRALSQYRKEKILPAEQDQSVGGGRQENNLMYVDMPYIFSSLLLFKEEFTTKDRGWQDVGLPEGSKRGSS